MPSSKYNGCEHGPCNHFQRAKPSIELHWVKTVGKQIFTRTHLVQTLHPSLPICFRPERLRCYDYFVAISFVRACSKNGVSSNEPQAACRKLQPRSTSDPATSNGETLQPLVRFWQKHHISNLHLVWPGGYLQWRLKQLQSKMATKQLGNCLRGIFPFRIQIHVVAFEGEQVWKAQFT